MDKGQINEVDLAVLYLDSIPPDRFDPIRDLAISDDLTIAEESRENAPYAALEWFIPTAIAVYVGMKFIDAFLGRAAQDFADTTYPRVKDALLSVAKRFLIDERAAFGVVSSSPLKSTNPYSSIFSILAVSRFGVGIKFVFDRPLSLDEYENAIDAVFRTLQKHFSSDDERDDLLTQLEKLGLPQNRMIFLIYNESEQRWDVVDPVRRELDRQNP